LPPLSSCTFTPSQVASGRGDTNVVLKVVTTAASPSASLGGAAHLLGYDLGLTFTGVALVLGRVKKSRGRRQKGVRIAILGALLGLLVACGGGTTGGSGGGGSGASHPGTTPGNYTITVTGAVGSVTRTTEAVLTVK
jgi:hypothetical protein